jgi:predicted DCC family thiol-disulfide oxidoreductase YuxK
VPKIREAYKQIFTKSFVKGKLKKRSFVQSIMANPDRIVFIDGHCTLCNRWVQFVLKRDKSQRMYFAPIQGSTASTILTQKDQKEVNYIQYYRDQRFYIRSRAVIRILRDLGGLWKIAVILHLVPPFIRDAFYRFVANRRYTWFPRKDTCEFEPGLSSKNLLA